MAEGQKWKPLYRSEIVTIGDYCCRPHDCACGPEEFSHNADFAFPRWGAFVKHVGRREFLADANQVVFFNRGETYRVSHPVHGGDDCTTFTVREDVLRDALAAHDVTARDRAQLFSCSDAPSPPAAFLLQTRLLAGLRGAEPAEFAAEEQVFELLDLIFSQPALRPQRRQRRERRPDTRVAHRDAAHAVRLLLAEKFREKLTLAGAARCAHCSPYHLARVFRAEMGLPLHRYLTRLRLRAALREMQDRPGGLTAVALACGFYDHSHFTNAFRAEFGLTPAAFECSPHRQQREMSMLFQA